MTGAPETAQAPVAVFKKRGAKGKNIRKREATPPRTQNSHDSDFSSSGDDDDDDDEAGPKAKRRKVAKGALTASSKSQTRQEGNHHAATVFEADRNRELDSLNDATKQSNWYDDQDEEGALSAKKLLGSTRQLPRDDAAGGAPDGTYKGLAHQTSYIQKKPDAPKRNVGPIKAPTNIRTITITDMAPDVCKDYKRSGFCGFGDNCKFLHARENYLEGWQLDQEWDKVTKGKKNLGGTIVASADRKATGGEQEFDADEEAMLQGIPFVCIICEEDYKSPVVTRCGHYFCESCALQRYRKDPSCAACGAGTSGVFNSAKRLQKLLEKKRNRAEKRRQQAIEDGEEVGSEEET